jgi:hypothetical protein
MAEPKQNVDSNGVLDDETADPSENTNAPDPLLGEAARSGALSTPAPGSAADQQARVQSNRSAMKELQNQYGNIQSGISGSFQAEQKALEAARDRLLQNNPYMPSDKELALQQAAAWGGARDSAGRFDPSAISASKASGMAQQREAEQKKQELLNQYGIQIPQAQLGQYNAMGNSLIQRMRIQQAADTSAENSNANTTKANNAIAAHGANSANGMVFNPQKPNPDGTTGGLEYHPEVVKANADAAALKAKEVQAAKLAGSALSAGSMDPAQIDFAATWLHDKGTMPPGYQTRMMNGGVNPVTTMIYKAMAAKYPNESASQVIAGQGMIAASQKVLQDYQTGATSKDLNKLNTAVQHISVLNPAIDALNNGPVSFLNTIGNTWNQKIMGKPAPTDFNGVRDFVVGEISKAVLPNGGGEREREALAASASSANSPAALKSIVQKWQQLLAGKTLATENQWNSGTMDPSTGKPRFGTFQDKFLMPETVKALGRQPSAVPQTGASPNPGQNAAPATPPPKNAQGWMLHHDAQGNMAYVSPDGKQFTPVK